MPLVSMVDRAHSAHSGPMHLIGVVLLLMLAAGIVLGILFILRLNARKGRPWRRGIRLLRGRPVSGLGVVALLGAVFFLQIMVLSTSLWWLPLIARGHVSDEIAAVLVGGATLHGAVILLVWAGVTLRKLSWRKCFETPATWGWTRRVVWGIGGYLIALPLVALSAWLWQRGLTAIGVEVVLQDLMRLVLEARPMWARGCVVLLAVVVAPVAEELLFRGLILPPLSRAIGVIGAVLVSSLVFAAIHMHVAALVPIFVLSIACSLAYIHTASLTVPIVIHAVFNGVSVILFVLTHGFVD